MTFGLEYFFPTVYLLSIVGCVLIATYCVGFLVYIGDGIGNHAKAHIGPPTKNIGRSKTKSYFETRRDLKYFNKTYHLYGSFTTVTHTSINIAFKSINVFPITVVRFFFLFR